ncbi:MAG: hypothetical protein BWK76_13245 [Desulfobulbaceae bacterium A2]|nr:MAG: hypothetical protein BWK76_13245 [Desulfobulbaceae bacterium A2]
MPRVSVVMPVYNGGRYLRKAVYSVLRQHFNDFEFIIIDDGSSDGSQEIVRQSGDSRIVFSQNEKNMGVANTLNKGMDLARGEYIARMDADDVCLPDRLERQVRFMQAHPEVGISGSWIRLFGNGLPYTAKVPLAQDEVSAYMLFENPFWHMTVIMRRQPLEDAGLRYDASFTRSEDFELWTRAVEHCQMVNMGEVCVRVRRCAGSATRANWEEVTAQTEQILGRMLERFGMKVTPQEVAFHHKVGRGYRLQSRDEVEKAEAWLLRILAENRRRRVYLEDALHKVLATVWFRVCANSGPLGPWIWRRWRHSPLSLGGRIRASEMLRFWAGIVRHAGRAATVPRQQAETEV